MGDTQISPLQKLKAAIDRFTNVVKVSLLSDAPPGVAWQNGQALPTAAQFRALSERYPLATVFPYESHDPETNLYYNHDTVGFMLYTNPATGLGVNELKILNQFFVQQHRSDALIQISLIADNNIDGILQPWFDLKKNSANTSNHRIFATLAQNRLDYFLKGKWDSLFQDQAFLVRNFHLIISYTMPGNHDLSEDDLSYLLKTREAIQGTLKSARMDSVSLHPERFINIMSSILNPTHEPRPALTYDPDNLLNAQIVDGDTALLIDAGAGSFVHNNAAYTMLPFHVKQYPQYWAGFNNTKLLGDPTNNILRLPCPFIITMTVNIPDQIYIKGKIKRQTARATQMVGSPASKYVPQWKDRKRDWDYVNRKVEDGNKLLEASYQVLLFTPQGREQDCEQALRGLYNSFGWLLSRSRYSPLHALLGALPMAINTECKRALKMFGYFQTRLSWTCTNIAPWIAEWKGTQTPMMLFTGRRGQLTYFDPFDNTQGNYNLACCATSGSGKSFLTQEWVCNCLGAGGRVFIIDAGHSYRNLCRLLNGTYIDFGDDHIEIRLNPFSFINTDDPKHFAEQVPLIKMLVAQMASPDAPLTPVQKGLLENAILHAWEKHKNAATITRIVGALETLNENDPDLQRQAKDLAVMLQSFTRTGMYGAYFEGTATVDLDNQFVVLELDALNAKPDLQSVVLLILMLRITQVMYLSKNKSQRKLCIIDEAWRLLSKGQAGDFIQEGFRVARKHGGSFMTITQRLSDYHSSPTAEAALSNSDYTLFLRQKADELALAAKKGWLDKHNGSVDLLRSLETLQGKYSELVIQSPKGFVPVRFIVDPFTEKLFSTKANEVEAIQTALAHGRNIMDAVKELSEKQQR